MAPLLGDIMLVDEGRFSVKAAPTFWTVSPRVVICFFTRLRKGRENVIKRTRGESMRSADWEAQDYLDT